MCTTGQDGRGTAKDKGKATHLHPTTFHKIFFLVVRQKNINQYIFFLSLGFPFFLVFSTVFRVSLYHQR